jgi:hypothetical protein
VEKGDGNPANEKRLCRLGRLAGATILRLLLAVDQSTGWPMLARDSGKQTKGTEVEEEREKRRTTRSV